MPGITDWTRDLFRRNRPSVGSDIAPSSPSDSKTYSAMPAPASLPATVDAPADLAGGDAPELKIAPHPATQSFELQEHDHRNDSFSLVYPEPSTTLPAEQLRGGSPTPSEASGFSELQTAQGKALSDALAQISDMQKNQKSLLQRLERQESSIAELQARSTSVTISTLSQPQDSIRREQIEQARIIRILDDERRKDKADNDAASLATNTWLNTVWQFSSDLASDVVKCSSHISDVDGCVQANIANITALLGESDKRLAEVGQLRLGMGQLEGRLMQTQMYESDMRLTLKHLDSLHERTSKLENDIVALQTATNNQQYKFDNVEQLSERLFHLQADVNKIRERMSDQKIMSNFNRMVDAINTLSKRMEELYKDVAQLKKSGVNQQSPSNNTARLGEKVVELGEEIAKLRKCTNNQQNQCNDTLGVNQAICDAIDEIQQWNTVHDDTIARISANQNESNDQMKMLLEKKVSEPTTTLRNTVTTLAKDIKNVVLGAKNRDKQYQATLARLSGRAHEAEARYQTLHAMVTENNERYERVEERIEGQQRAIDLVRHVQILADADIDVDTLRCAAHGGRSNQKKEESRLKRKASVTLPIREREGGQESEEEEERAHMPSSSREELGERVDAVAQCVTQ